MANFDEIMQNHADSFKDGNDKQTVDGLTEKLNGLGYDIIFNNKEKAEFVPSSRLSDIASQRDTFKSQVEIQNKQLEDLKANSEGNVKAQKEIQALMDKNTELLTDLERVKVDSEILLEASDAVNPKDILLFVDYNNIKQTAKGEARGVKEEIDRIRKEKPYFFPQRGSGNRAGFDSGAGAGDNNSGRDMNFLLRRAAGHTP